MVRSHNQISYSQVKQEYEIWNEWTHNHHQKINKQHMQNTYLINNHKDNNNHWHPTRLPISPIHSTPQSIHRRTENTNISLPNRPL